MKSRTFTSAIAQIPIEEGVEEPVEGGLRVGQRVQQIHEEYPRLGEHILDLSMADLHIHIKKRRHDFGDEGLLQGRS